MAASDDNYVFGIDLHRLHEQWAEQDSLTYKWGLKLAAAEKAYRQAEADLDLVKAELTKKVKLKPKVFGLKDAPPVEIIKATVTAHPRVVQAQQLVIDTQYKMNRYKAAVAAVSARKAGLENEVQLWSQSYFADPKVPYSVSREVKERLEEERMKQARRVTKKR